MGPKNARRPNSGANLTSPKRSSAAAHVQCPADSAVAHLGHNTQYRRDDGCGDDASHTSSREASGRDGRAYTTVAICSLRLFSLAPPGKSLGCRVSVASNIRVRNGRMPPAFIVHALPPLKRTCRRQSTGDGKRFGSPSSEHRRPKARPFSLVDAPPGLRWRLQHNDIPQGAKEEAEETPAAMEPLGSSVQAALRSGGLPGTPQ